MPSLSQCVVFVEGLIQVHGLIRRLCSDDSKFHVSGLALSFEPQTQSPTCPSDTLFAILTQSKYYSSPPWLTAVVSPPQFPNLARPRPPPHCSRQTPQSCNSSFHHSPSNLTGPVNPILSLCPQSVHCPRSSLPPSSSQPPSPLSRVTDIAPQSLLLSFFPPMIHCLQEFARAIL